MVSEISGMTLGTHTIAVIVNEDADLQLALQAVLFAAVGTASASTLDPRL